MLLSQTKKYSLVRQNLIGIWVPSNRTWTPSNRVLSVFIRSILHCLAGSGLVPLMTSFNDKPTSRQPVNFPLCHRIIMMDFMIISYCHFTYD